MHMQRACQSLPASAHFPATRKINVLQELPGSCRVARSKIG